MKINRVMQPHQHPGHGYADERAQSGLFLKYDLKCRGDLHQDSMITFGYARRSRQALDARQPSLAPQTGSSRGVPDEVP